MASNYEAICEDNRRRYGTEGAQKSGGLAAGLYDDRTHFIFELLQNAEDALGRRSNWHGPRKVAFALTPTRLTLSHFGKPFDEADVRSVCDIAESTKNESSIGRFGLGFKSVYTVTDLPEIHSGVEDFSIEGYVFPKRADRTAREADETQIILPLRSEDTTATQDITAGFRHLGPGALLFLRLLGGALLFQIGLALGFFLGARLLVDRALGHGLLAGGDAGFQTRQGRRLRVGLLHQREQALGFDEVFAADALLGGDQSVRLQIGQRADYRRIVRLLVPQRQVVLHGVVAGRRVQALLAQGRAGGLAQLVRAHGGDLGRDGRRRRRGRGGRSGRSSVGRSRLVLAAAGDGAGQRYPQREVDTRPALFCQPRKWLYDEHLRISPVVRFAHVCVGRDSGRRLSTMKCLGCPFPAIKLSGKGIRSHPPADRRRGTVPDGLPAGPGSPARRNRPFFKVRAPQGRPLAFLPAHRYRDRIGPSNAQSARARQLICRCRSWRRCGRAIGRA